MQIDIKLLIIIVLLIALILLYIKLSIKTKIKQTRYKSDSQNIVKSRAELIIANWLFHHGIDFIYEKKLNLKQKVISDFYLTRYDIYIEFWGLQTPSYIKRKKQKIKIYKKNHLKLIQMDDDSLRNLTNFFSKEFRKFGIKFDPKFKNQSKSINLQAKL